jgi:protein SCO1
MKMKRTWFLMAVLFLAPGFACSAQTYSARGLVLKVDRAHSSVLISCERIPDFMEAMVMEFPVPDPGELAGLNVGATVEFTLVVDEQSYIEKIHVRRYESAEQDPIAAKRLKLMAGILEGSSRAQTLKIGEPVPNFILVDQEQRNVALSQFSGKVVVLTFTYTHCALPNFCFRIANHFRLLQKRFASELGRNLIFMTVTFDPAHDTPETMAKYGKTWNADPASWKLLSGAPSEVQKICDSFGISFWADEGLMTHSLHTFVLDRDRRLVADLEGNEFTTDELGDLVQTVLARDSGKSLRASAH